MRLAAIKMLAGPALLLGMAGCVSLGGGKPPPFLLTLSADKQVPAGTVASGTGTTAIMVMEPETDQRLAVLRIPVQVDDTQVAYLVGTAWVERPSRLFRGLLADTDEFPVPLPCGILAAGAFAAPEECLVRSCGSLTG